MPRLASLFPLLIAVMAVPAPAATVDYLRDVKPLFTQHCARCHGEAKQEGGLRLDTAAWLFEGGFLGDAVFPGAGDESLLLRVLTGTDGTIPAMPYKADPLSAAQIATIRTWIDEGAGGAPADEPPGVYNHWSYVDPAPVTPPAVKGGSWGHNPIDRFVLARLEAEGLAPAPPADRATLLRRVHLDLTGLPPTPAETNAFLADRHPDAYERVVDRLLASPRYGERWAYRWLDLARYADSNGYEKDRLRSIWPWRDWVVDALNRDLPFDQFTIEQLAGDLLPDATLAQKTATGFHRNTMLNQEGGVDPEEYRALAVADRVNTTGTVWLGSTLSCAQCHDHKFDAFSQKEYFQLYAFFDQSADETRMISGSLIEDISARVTLPHPKEAELKARAAAIEEFLRQADVTADLAAWEQSQSNPGWSALQILEAVAGRNKAATLAVQDDGSVLAGGDAAAPVTYTISARTNLPLVTAFRLEVLTDDSLPGGGPGRGADGGFALSRFGVAATPAYEEEHPDRLGLQLQNPTASAAETEFPITRALIRRADATGGWRVGGPAGSAATAAFSLAEPVPDAAGMRFTIVLEQIAKDAGPIGKFRLSASGGTPAPHVVPPDIAALLAIARDSRTAEQQAALGHWYRPFAPSLQPERDELAGLQQQLATPLTTLVMEERAEPRETRIHERGNFLSPGEVVGPDVPGVLPPLPADAPRNRLGLARWLVAPDNPLTPRVTVNRMWEAFFGRGLVLTSEDFGVQGAAPTHPELLDWLAREFVQRGWSVKAMHRLIVNSAAYQQASAVTPALLERDPANTLLARGSRFRLEAELIRDQALAAAGLLSRRMGGPGVYPSQPDNTWMFAFNEDRWTPSIGEDRHRRGLYTIWRRSAPYPSFLTFDATSREAICTRRPRSNTPLQALTTLNDPQYFEAAVGLARRILAEAGPDAGARAAHGFQLAVVRPPRGPESDRLQALHRQQRENFNRDPGAAAALIASYLAPGELPTAELAAWTMVANVLLNLDETLTRE